MWREGGGDIGNVWYYEGCLILVCRRLEQLSWSLLKEEREVCAGVCICM